MVAAYGVQQRGQQLLDVSVQHLAVRLGQAGGPGQAALTSSQPLAAAAASAGDEDEGSSGGTALPDLHNLLMLLLLPKIS